MLGMLGLVLFFDNFNLLNIFILKPLESGKMHDYLEKVIFKFFDDFFRVNILKWRKYAQLLYFISQTRHIKQCFRVYFKGDFWGQF